MKRIAAIIVLLMSASKLFAEENQAFTDEDLIKIMAHIAIADMRCGIKVKHEAFLDAYEMALKTMTKEEVEYRTVAAMHNADVVLMHNSKKLLNGFCDSMLSDVHKYNMGKN